MGAGVKVGSRETGELHWAFVCPKGRPLPGTQVARTRGGGRAQVWKVGEGGAGFCPSQPTSVRSTLLPALSPAPLRAPKPGLLLAPKTPKRGDRCDPLSAAPCPVCGSCSMGNPHTCGVWCGIPWRDTERLQCWRARGLFGAYTTLQRSRVRFCRSALHPARAGCRPDASWWAVQ